MLIKNAMAADPAEGTLSLMDIRIEGKVISRTGRSIDPEEGEDVIDVSGCIAAPGLVDTHVHFRDPGFTRKEDIISGAGAAARGGFTTVVCMANTKPAVDNPEVLSYIQKKAEQTGIHVLQASAITMGLEGKKLVDMEKMAKCGAALPLNYRSRICQACFRKLNREKHRQYRN